MREELRRRLDEELKNDRYAFRILVGLIAITFVILGIAYYLLTGVETQRSTQGIVRWAESKIESRTGRRISRIQVELEDGRIVNVATTLMLLPQLGSKIVMRERTQASGYHEYVWDGER